MANVSKKSGSKGRDGVSKYEYSSPGSRSDESVLEGKEVTLDGAVDEAPVIALTSVGSLDCMGKPISVAELVLLVLVLV